MDIPDPVVVVLPAHAGMIPNFNYGTSGGSMCSPRTRG